MNSTKMDIDIISDLPEALICHILSFLSTKEAALTSLLSKRWRYLFAFVPNLDFDDFVFCRPYRDRNEVKREFMDFVDRVLGLQGNSTIDRFSLKCNGRCYQFRVYNWISNVIERGVSDLDLRGTVVSKHSMPSSVFVSNSLVRLRIETTHNVVIDSAHVHVFLPKLKTLHLDYVVFGDGDSCLVKLISGCPVLEELVMIELRWRGYWNRSVSSKTLKRLTVRSVAGEAGDAGPYRISFDTPNLVYFEYDDYVTDKFGTVNFDSLVEARIGLLMTSRQIVNASYGDLVVNATNLFMGISNVQILHLCSDTIEVLTYCCEPIPVFKNLIQLTVMTREHLGWESLPALLKNCPKLETLVFEGLAHRKTIKCKDADGCLCKSSEVDIRSCLSSSPVKVLKILNFVPFYSEEKEKWAAQVKYFLETMPNLEHLILCYHSLIDEDLKSQLERLVPRGASPKCRIQLTNV